MIRPVANPPVAPSTSAEKAALGALGRATGSTAPEDIRDAASQVVAQLFFAPLLAEMRRLPFGRSVGSGGRGEEVFGEQLDQRIAEHAAAGDLAGLKSLIETDLLKRSPKAAKDAPASAEAAPAASPPPTGPVMDWAARAKTASWWVIE